MLSTARLYGLLGNSSFIFLFAMAAGLVFGGGAPSMEHALVPVLAVVMTRVIRSAVHGISTIDLVSIVVTVAMLTATSLLASYLPARRAAKVDPMVALRHE